LELDDFLVALDAFGVTWSFLDSLIERIVEEWIPMCFKGGKLEVKRIQNNFVMSGTLSSNQDIKKLNLSIIKSNIIHLAEFISNHMFKQLNEELIDKWSLALSKELQQLSIIRSDQDEIQSMVKNLEVELLYLNYLSPANIPLLNCNLEKEILKTKKIEILVNAKEILDSHDKNTCEISDGIMRGGFGSLLGKKGSMDTNNVYKAGKEQADEDFCVPTMHVSNQAQSLVDMVYETLDQISKSKNPKDIEYLYTARDLFDLYRAIVSVDGFISITLDNTQMMTLHDCKFLAYQLNTIGHQYSELIESLSKDPFSFLDGVSMFHSMGREVFTESLMYIIKSHQRMLIENISSLDLEGCIQLEKNMSKCLNSLGKLSAQWRVS
jgi:hypothetical protein